MDYMKTHKAGQGIEQQFPQDMEHMENVLCIGAAVAAWARTLLPATTNAVLQQKSSPELLEVNLGHEVVSGAEELSGFEVKPSKVQAQLEHAVTAEIFGGGGVRTGEPRERVSVRSGETEHNSTVPARAQEHETVVLRGRNAVTVGRARAAYHYYCSTAAQRSREGFQTECDGVSERWF